MSTRDIATTFKEMYDANISATLVSNVTQAVITQAIEWRHQSLDEIYPIVYLDGIILAGVLNDMVNRGVKDILIASVDGLTGFPEAINAVFPQADVQLCIVHMVRNSLKYVGHQERQKVAGDLKQIYQSMTEEEALLALDEFEHCWDNVATLFAYSEAIRKAIYRTNAIESLNSVIRKSIKNRKIFNHDDSAFKVVFLAIEAASKKMDNANTKLVTSNESVYNPT